MGIIWSKLKSCSPIENDDQQWRESQVTIYENGNVRINGGCKATAWKNPVKHVKCSKSNSSLVLFDSNNLLMIY